MIIWIVLIDLTRRNYLHAFFSKLSGSPCSDSEYTYVTRAWDAFGCEHGRGMPLDVNTGVGCLWM